MVLLIYMRHVKIGSGSPKRRNTARSNVIRRIHHYIQLSNQRRAFREKFSVLSNVWEGIAHLLLRHSHYFMGIEFN